MNKKQFFTTTMEMLTPDEMAKISAIRALDVARAIRLSDDEIRAFLEAKNDA